MSTKNFTGDKKVPMRSLLARYERRLIDSNLRRFPRWLQGYHLTLTSILWSAGIVFFGYLARGNLPWLWGSSAMLFLQWFSDSFDGALGKYRDTGIPKWGYYMDHLLDYVFMSSIMLGYAFLFSGAARQIIYLLIPVSGGFMVSAYLAFGATGEFKITYLGFGPTEIRICFVLLNGAFIWLGTAWLEPVLVYVLVAALLGLVVVVYRTQKHIWGVDHAKK